MREKLIHYLDTTEDMMIFFMEQRDRPGASRAEIILCNKLWNMCRVIYDALKEEIRRKNV